MDLAAADLFAFLAFLISVKTSGHSNMYRLHDLWLRFGIFALDFLDLVCCFLSVMDNVKILFHFERPN